MPWARNTGVTPSRFVLVALAFGVSLYGFFLPLAAWAGGSEGAQASPMVRIEAGRFLPLYAESPGPITEAGGLRAVDTFYLDQHAVTNAQYLAFVRESPRWQRSKVTPLFVDPGYLEHWEGDIKPGERAPPLSPVVQVSWFAARAYCAAQGKRLPTTDEWEYAGAASETSSSAQADVAFQQRLLNWYAKPAPRVLPPVESVYRNIWGAYDLHGLIWEWTLDFNTALVTGESRQDSDLERKLFCGAAAAGASNTRDYAAFMRHGFRSSLQARYTVSSLGFRCARPDRSSAFMEN